MACAGALSVRHVEIIRMLMDSGLELVIFDLDGTLVEFHHEYLFSETHRILQKMGRAAVPSERLRNSFAVFDYFSFVGAKSERDSFVEEFWSLFNWEGFPTVSPFPHAISTLEDLVTLGLRVAIVTARFMPREKLLHDLAPTGFPDVISHLITRPGDHIHWTDKRGTIREMCRALNVAPEHALMVGDVPTDITSAYDVGLSGGVAVLSGGINREILALAEPLAIIDDISQLLPLVNVGTLKITPS